MLERAAGRDVSTTFCAIRVAHYALISWMLP